MLRELRPIVVVFVALTVITGIVYPLAVTGVADVLFSRQAHGSMIADHGHVIGSSLIGQPFDDPRYFWGRPSQVNYDATTSSGTNLGPTNPALHDAVVARIAALRAAGDAPSGLVPVDLVTASASGLDPDITPAAARFQIARVAHLRGLPVATVAALVDRGTERPLFGVLGESRVNVLALNRGLDALASPPGSAQ